MYIFQLMDYYSASGMSLIWVCFFQTIGVSWAFGVDKLSDCIEQMMGRRPSQFMCICWKYLAPFTMLVGLNIPSWGCILTLYCVSGDIRQPLFPIWEFDLCWIQISTLGGRFGNRYQFIIDDMGSGVCHLLCADGARIYFTGGSYFLVVLKSLLSFLLNYFMHIVKIFIYWCLYLYNIFIIIIILKIVKLIKY